MLDAEHPRDMPLPCQLWNHRPAREAIFRIWSSQACDSDQFNIVEPLLTDSNKDDQIWPIMTNHNRTPSGPCEPRHVNTSVLRFIGSWKYQKVLFLRDLNEAPYQRWHPQLTTACYAPSPCANFALDYSWSWNMFPTRNCHCNASCNQTTNMKMMTDMMTVYNMYNIIQ